MNKDVQSHEDLGKPTFYECFLGKLLELRFHQKKGVNQEDMGSRKEAKEGPRSPREQIIQTRAGGHRGLQDGCLKKRGTVWPHEKQKSDGFYKSVRVWEELVHDNQTNESN